MRLRLDYGSEGLDVDLPDERVTVIEPSFLPALEDPHAALVAALRQPIGRPPLRDIARPGQKVAISVCDITRAQPRPQMLRALFDEMPGVNPHDVTILIATGTHRANTPDELQLMLERAGFGEIVVHGDHVRAQATPDDEFVVFVVRR